MLVARLGELTDWIYLIVECPNKTEGCPAPARSYPVVALVPALLNCVVFKRFPTTITTTPVVLSAVSHCFFPLLTDSEQKNNGVFRCACAVSAQGLSYPTCNGTFVVFQTDTSAIYECDAVQCSGHDNDWAIKGAEKKSQPCRKKEFSLKLHCYLSWQGII